MIGAAMILPHMYLVLRTLGAGEELWELLFRVRTLEVLGRTLILILGVALASVAISLPLAWLTTRTDIPLRRVWSILTALPLVIPSYVAGFVVVAALGPKGMLQRLLEGPFGVVRLPEIYGFPGALITIVLVSYPLVLLTLQASLRGIDPSLEEASQSLGQSQVIRRGYLYIIIRTHVYFNLVARLFYQGSVIGYVTLCPSVSLGDNVKAKYLRRLYRP